VRDAILAVYFDSDPMSDFPRSIISNGGSMSMHFKKPVETLTQEEAAERTGAAGGRDRRA
jgi:hypothetical protein